MIIEALALIVLFGGAACAVALVGTTKEKLDERLYGASEDHESSEW